MITTHLARNLPQCRKAVNLPVDRAATMPSTVTRDRPTLRANQTPRVEIEPSGFAWVGLNNLVVHPDHRGRGHGRTLVNARLSWAYGLVLDRPIFRSCATMKPHNDHRHVSVSPRPISTGIECSRHRHVDLAGSYVHGPGHLHRPPARVGASVA